MLNRRIAAAAILGVWPALAAGQDPTVSTWTVPGVVKSAGQNGTNFVSDIVITNPGVSPATVVLGFAPALQGTPEPQFLSPGQSLILEDAVATAFGATQAVGAIRVTSDQPLVIRGRTYNTASTGTFGVALPVIGDDRFLSEGQSADSLWVDQEATSNRGYRTNVAVLFPDSGGGAATVTLYDALGNPAGQRSFSLDDAGLQQFGVGTFATGALPVGRARIEVTRGRAAGYSVVVDNVTGDGSLFPFEDLPAGVQDVVVNGVSRANGQLGTFWRTDARLYNPADQDAAVTVFFHAAGNANPAPLSRRVTVPAGRILDLPDVLGALMGLPVGSSGALRIQSDMAVAVLCRTSNLDPTGAKPGTFGSQQKAVPLMSYLTSADAGAVVTGVRQGGAFRTNVGFASGPNGATYALALKTATGETTRTATASLGAFGWAQPGVGILFPGSIPDGAQLVVRVTSGSLDVFDSSIDNGSGDPVVTPAARLPQDVPATATIGPAGGAIRSADGRLTLKVPAGALSAPTVLSIHAASAAVPNGVDSGYVISPDGVSFARDALLVLAWAPKENVDVEYLGLAYQDGPDWYAVTGGSQDVSARTLTIPLRRTRPAASTRTPLDGGGGVTFAAFRGLKMAPESTEAVVEGSTRGVDFTVSDVGPGSAQVSTVGRQKIITIAPRGDLYWLVNGVEGGNTSVGTISGKPTGHYTVPSCPPAVNPVHIDAGYRSTQKVALHGTVYVYPREWKVTISWDVTTFCPSNVSDYRFSMKWGEVMTHFFSLDDSLNVIDNSLAQLGDPRTTNQPHLCPTGGTCIFRDLHINDYPAGAIDSAGGRWNLEKESVGVDLVFTNIGFPSFTRSNDSCRPPRPAPNPSPQSGFEDRNETYDMKPKGYEISAEVPVGGSEFSGTQTFTVNISPQSSPSCPR